MYTGFTASESVKILVENEEIPIKHYLRQPQRLVKAIANPRLMKQLSADLYELKMRPINFMEMYHFQPIVNLKVWAGRNSTVCLKSASCQIKGIDYINKRFSLQLKGVLYPEEIKGQTYLQGQADLGVKVELPPALVFTPQPLLEVTGNRLLKSVLARIKQRLVSQLLQDYREWTVRETGQEQTKSVAKLSTDLGLI
ncbi:MAG: DUF1997 domain-containing protein [Xenococcaceae cyanobacterium MO_188.B29]|nr:DUF1997 domain-containing protein [Xenococcaceae cyanobacterium MO_188.B29]